MNKFSKFFAIAMIALLGTSAFAIDASKVNKKRHTPQGLYLTASEAASFIQKNKANTLFVDIRTQVEVEYVGHSYLMDKNIPWHFKDVSKWNEKKSRFSDTPKNANFIADIEAALKAKGLNKDSNIVVMCRSGSRSTKAAKLLSKNGYKKVYNIIDGFEGYKGKTKQRTVNGWKLQAPANTWGYKLDKSKMYGLK